MTLNWFFNFIKSDFSALVRNCAVEERELSRSEHKCEEFYNVYIYSHVILLNIANYGALIT